MFSSSSWLWFGAFYQFFWCRKQRKLEKRSTFTFVHSSFFFSFFPDEEILKRGKGTKEENADRKSQPVGLNLGQQSIREALQFPFGFDWASVFSLPSCCWFPSLADPSRGSELSGVDPGLVRRASRVLAQRGRGPWAQNLLKMGSFPLKLLNCMILKKKLGARGSLGPPVALFLFHLFDAPRVRGFCLVFNDFSSEHILCTFVDT